MFGAICVKNSYYFVNKLLDVVRVSKRAESVKESEKTRG